MFNLAGCYDKIGWLTATKKWLKRLLEINPKFQQAYKPLCLTYLKLGQYSEAYNTIDAGYDLFIRTEAWILFKNAWAKNFKKHCH